MSVLTLLAVVWLHVIADFILQSDYVARNKSKSNKVLLQHVAIYSLPFMILGIPYAIVNAVLHFAVDYVTSRMTSKLYSEGKVHWFFVVIGIDQAIHMSCLILTLSFGSFLLW